MANSKYEYVRHFEQHARLLPETWTVVRLDGRGFSKLTAGWGLRKPNDRRLLDVLNDAAAGVLRRFEDVVLAYGQSDEYSFVLRRGAALYGRREAKIVSSIASVFTALVVFSWSTHFAADVALREDCLPSFDARAVSYPTPRILRDYLAWRQADCHVNNLYNTTFWALVGGGMSAVDAEVFLKGTFASDKNEILWSRFGINYNREEAIFRKGSVVFHDVDRSGGVEARNAETDLQLGGGEGPGDGGSRQMDTTVAARERDDAVSTEDQSSASVQSEVAASKPSDRSKVHTDDGGPTPVLSKTQQDKERKRRAKAKIVIEHIDLIQDAFWKERPWILAGTAPPRMS